MIGGSGAARLHVEQDEAGGYVYRLVEAETGRLLAELPRMRACALDLAGFSLPGAAIVDAA